MGAGIFLSTPSARRATSKSSFRGLTLRISIHALREEGDSERPVMTMGISISIHALREEGDLADMDERIRWLISIHALREEGDP